MRDKEVRIRMVDYLIHRTHERQGSADKNGRLPDTQNT